MRSDATLCSLPGSESLFVCYRQVHNTVTAPVPFTSRRATERATRSNNNEALVPNQEFRNLTFFESRISIESFIISMLHYCNDLAIILALLSKYLSSSPMICNRSRSNEARHYAGHSLTSEELQRTGNHSSDPRYRIIRRLDGFTDAAPRFNYQVVTSEKYKVHPFGGTNCNVTSGVVYTYKLHGRTTIALRYS
jgi:hypothetical protein